MNKQQVSLVRCGSYDSAEVYEAVRKSVDLLGGIEGFVKPGEKVLLKPNLLTDTEPDKGITTHPEVVRAVIRLLKPITKNIFCGDAPSVWGEKRDVDRVYETTGMKKVCFDEGAELVYFTHPVLTNGYPIADWVFKCDRLINIPKFKTHAYTVLTAALKNLFGLIVGMHKMKVHFDNPKPSELSKVIVDIYQLRKPDLNILDGIVAMEGQGPGSAGTLREFDLIASCQDGLSMDLVLTHLMNLEVLDVPTNKEAINRGLAAGGLGPIEILGDKLRDFAVSDFKLPRAGMLSKLPKMPKFAADAIASFLTGKPCPVFSKCKLCGACQKICPAGAMREENNRMILDRKKCILCLCCQEVCPHNAIEIKKSLLMKLLVR
jgi:uncharacterized protein (DUF362 family)/NAD-dependent dihydropyrimidine dehydrogenase PreA subunit